VAAKVILRPYREDDLEEALSLWHRAWDATIPDIDFSKRLDWWRNRWINELLPMNTITIAKADNRTVGFVVINPNSGYLDQIVVDPASWGSGVATLLLAEAKRQSPLNITLDVNQSNSRAIRFYEREAFVRQSGGKNPISGKPTWRYVWKR
jgi:putative acetyltransferase